LNRTACKKQKINKLSREGRRTSRIGLNDVLGFRFTDFLPESVIKGLEKLRKKKKR